MRNDFNIGPLSDHRIKEFFDYLNDHISDNGKDDTPMFLPISRQDLKLPKEIEKSFKEGQDISMDGKGWRRIFIASNNEGKIIGHIDLKSQNQNYTNHRAMLGMGVHRAYRKQGLGSSLIASIVNWAKINTQISYIDLRVLSSNLAAIKLYEKLGFQKVGEIKDMFRIDGESYNDIRMVKKIK